MAHLHADDDYHPAHFARGTSAFLAMAAFATAAGATARRHGVKVRDVVMGIEEAARCGSFAAGREAGGARKLAAARREAIYLAVTTFGTQIKPLARALGVSPKLVRKAISCVEEQRDDAAVDRALDEIELQLTQGA